MREHPTATGWLLDALRDERYPVSISTDDSSVFGTSASAELARGAIELKLDAEHVVHLAIRALDDAFEPAGSEAMLELKACFARQAAAALALYREETLALSVSHDVARGPVPVCG
mmetsp:Transcript_13616/g.34696  ORF Transcript_13616/g.34696 Transcript_13616/m.34696 type:complete len:115 (-) Transcript_13616:38-382(-)